MILIVCEKENAARRISSILGGGRVRRENLNGVTVYRINSPLGDAAVVGLKGHILNLDYPDEYNQWNRVDPEELIKVESKKVLTDRRRGAALKKLAREAEGIIIATDYDREGELIGKEAVEWALKDMKNRPWVKRARFSALTPQEIKFAFENLKDVDDNLASSAEVRQVVDLLWGAVLTRLISLSSGRLGKDFLSVGRVQSPTLALIVEREKEIQAFKPTPYWEINGILEKGLKFPTTHSNGRFTDERRAKEVFDKVRGAKTAKVSSVRSKVRVDKPPAPFNTTAFLRAANSLGLSAARAMSIAEDLYTRGYISYPRTDNTVYPPSIDLKGVLKTLLQGEFSDLARSLLEQSVLTPTRGKTSATDHPPIHPVGVPKPGELKAQERKIYELIVRRFFATLAPPSKVKVTQATFDISGESFSSSGTTIVDPGWRKYYPYSKVKEVLLPDLNVGDLVNVVELKLEKKMTKPPGRYSQGGLVELMEKLGLGTKSTRHEIIQKLYSRGYVKSSPPVPTEVGIALAEALKKYAKDITGHEMTSSLEAEMEEVASGKKDPREVIEDSRKLLAKVVEVLKENSQLVGEEIRKALKEQTRAGRCPRCGAEMVEVRSRWGKRYLRCSNYPRCGKTYPLPQKGEIKYTEERCPVCGA
ncbi:MAG: DNA topoisomerase I, partial [Thermoplasmata archaeon]|nr:DNA topoisomerase I [Thermoplasmata archaeon]